VSNSLNFLASALTIVELISYIVIDLSIYCIDGECMLLGGNSYLLEAHFFGVATYFRASLLLIRVRYKPWDSDPSIYSGVNAKKR